MTSKDLSAPPQQQASDDTTERQLAPGTQIRQYKITGALRTGGMGRVYLALDLSSGERVAIKKPLVGYAGEASDQAPHKTSSIEAKILSRVRHPNVVRLLDTVEDSNGDYLVLEYVEGMDLENFLQKAGPGLSELALRDFLVPVADALEALHRSGFIHRDVKPSNLRIRPSGEPILVDFGAAAPLVADGRSRSAWSAVTDGYAAPELYSDDHPEGPWSDIYSLAAIAYRALSGEAPAPALERLSGHPFATAEQIGQGRYSRRFLLAVDKGLDLNAASRPGSAALWAEAIADDTPLDPDEERRHTPANPAPPTAPAASTTSTATPPEATAEVPTAQEDTGPIDPYPPTLEVRRRPLGNLAAPPESTSRPTAAATAPQQRAWGGILVTLLLLAALASGGFWFGWPYYLHNIKETWIVDPAGKGDTESISDALAQAKDGATIEVMPGTYRENLSIARPVRLLASGSPVAAAVIAPDSGPCLVVTADSGTVSGFALRGAPRASDPTIEPALPGPTPVCLDIAHGAVRLEKLEVSNPSGIGVRLQDGAEAVMSEILVNDTATQGIVFAEGANGRLSDSNILRSGGVGLTVLSGAAPDIGTTTIADSGSGGVLYAKGAGGHFIDNAVAASAFSGIEVRAAASPEITGNTIVESGQAGIYIRGAGPTVVTGNQIAGSGLTGVLVIGTKDIALRDNSIEGSGEHGLLLLRDSEAAVIGNSFLNNSGYGIGIEKGSSVLLEANQLEGNKEPQIQRDGEGRVRAATGPEIDEEAAR